MLKHGSDSRYLLQYQFNLDLPAKLEIISVALGKIVGVLGNEARMVIKL